MGGKSKSKETVTTRGTETTTPTYQSYATPIVESMRGPMQSAFTTSIAGYGEPGYNPYQQALWSQLGQQVYGQYGTQGPTTQYLQPYMGQGYMNTLVPYYEQQQQYIKEALPAEKQKFLTQLKRDFGPAWGTHGRAFESASDAYAQWQALKARELGDIEAQKAQAAQAGMAYTAANVAQMNPFAWGQQMIGYAGAPEAATQEAMKSQQALTTGWSQPLTTLAGLGYAYPTSTTTVGEQTSRGAATGAQGGVSCCFIMNEAGDLTNAVRLIRDLRYKNDLEVTEGYKKMAGWLVPLMRNSSIVRFLVKWGMTHPIAVAIEKHQPILYPIGLFWETVWRIYGLPSKDRKCFNNVIKLLARCYSI